MLGVFFYTLTYVRVWKSLFKFWYILSLVGVAESFGVLLFQIFTRSGGKVSILLKDENTQYLLISLIFLYLRPYVIFPLIPFALFSIFHVLAYVDGTLLPIFGLENTPISKSIYTFTTSQNSSSIHLASCIEIFSFFWLLLRVVTFRKRSLIPFIVYGVFLKLRFEYSEITREYIKSIEIQVDEQVNHLNIPAIKNGWVQVKSVLRRVGGIYLVNNYNKQKST